MIIKVNGKTYEINSKEDLKAMMSNHYYDWFSVRTMRRDLLQLQYELYLDELDRQDELGSTGYYGKNAEVLGRLEYAVENHAKMYLHDVRCRGQKLDDQRIGKDHIEYKTSFAQWAYCASYQEGIDQLRERAAKGMIWKWDPFKDGCYIVMLLSDLLDSLAQYKPEKGLDVWFRFNAKKNQLQIQPVDLSEERRWWIEALVQGIDPREYVNFRKMERKARRQHAKDAE